MKKLFKSALILTVALTIALSSMILVAAEETTPPDDEVVISQAGGGESPMAFQLIWKYRYYNGVLQKRRWNATLGVWYDPYWINV